MANFDNIEVGGVLVMKDTSFMRDGEAILRYKDSYAVVIQKDREHDTVRIRFEDGKTMWVKSGRVSDTYEILE